MTTESIEQFTHEDVGKDHGSEGTKTPEDTEWLDDLLDNIRMTCEECEHPRCRDTIRAAKKVIPAHLQQEKLALLEQLKADGPKDKEYKKFEECWYCGYGSYSCNCEGAFNEANAQWHQTIDTAKQKIKEGA